jgi:hypothetical protein
MQVKLEHISLGYTVELRVMLAKKATFQRMGSGGKSRTENVWDVSGAGQSASPRVYISTVCTSRTSG